MTSPDVHTLTGAYALDALDEFERRQFEAHLAECPECEREVAELRATAARLGTAVAEPPPERLRRQVLNQIATTRQEPPVTDRPQAERPARRWGVRLTAAAAGLAILAAAALGVVVIRTQNKLDAAQSELSQAHERYGPIADVLSAQDARVDAHTVPGVGSAMVMSSHSLDRAVLMVSGMPAPPAKHTYQAWLVGSSGAPRPAGLLDVTGPGPAAPLPLDGLGGATEIKLTVEPAGGSAQPTTTPVMSVPVPA